MTNWLRHVLAAEYLYALESSPRAAPSGAAFLPMILLAIAMGLLWIRRLRLQTRGRWSAGERVALWATGSALLFYTLRLVVPGFLSARIWWLMSLSIAIGAVGLTAVRRRPHSDTVRTLVAALACRTDRNSPPLSARWQVTLGVLHAIGLYTLGRQIGLGAALLPAVCLVLAMLGARGDTRAPFWRSVHIEILTPLLLPYGAAVLRWLLDTGLGVDTAVYAAFPYPDLWSPLFDPSSMLIMASAWTLLVTLRILWRRPHRVTCGPFPLGPILLIGGLIWYGAIALTQRSHGATGSDPYCYLQMTADLVERGTLLHSFPLGELAWHLGLPTWPTVHIGYHPPTPGGQAATVWPVGWPLLMSPFYALGGEYALLWAAPVCFLLAALLTCAVGRRWAQGRGRWEGLFLGGTAAYLVLSSPESIVRSLVPMADAAAQALSLLTIYLLLRACREDNLRWSASAGAAFAVAYWVRHPLLPLGLSALCLLFVARRARRRRIAHLGLFAVAAALGALPDLLYHAQIFGAPWIAESPEWPLLSILNIPKTFMDLVRDGWLRRREFGYLLPLCAVGLSQGWRHRQERRQLACIGAGLLGVLLVGLSYSAVRWRDFIPLFPWLSLWAACGLLAMWRWANAPQPIAGRRALVLATALFLLSSRATRLAVPWDLTVRSFGYITQEERQEYARLAGVLAENAALGTGLSSGSVERYTRRPTFRPVSWTHEEATTFLAALRDKGTKLYLLEDGEEMASWLALRPDRWELGLVDTFDVPTFASGGMAMDRAARLYSVTVP